jgi:hypothetical protein
MAKTRQQPAAEEVSHIKDLKADPQNRRKHTPRNLGMVVDALQSVGAARSVVIDEDNVILAGNGVTEAAAEAGITKVQVVEADGDTLIAVRRRGLTVDQKRDLAMYDNRSGELAEWNAEQLRADAADGLDLRPYFSESELAQQFAIGEVVEDPLGEWQKREMPEFRLDAKAFRSLAIHFPAREDFDHFLSCIQREVGEATKTLWYKRPGTEGEGNDPA